MVSQYCFVQKCPIPPGLRLCMDTAFSLMLARGLPQAGARCSLLCRCSGHLSSIAGLSSCARQKIDKRDRTGQGGVNYTILIKHSYQGYLRYNHSNLTIAYQPYLAGEYHPPYMKEAVQE